MVKMVELKPPNSIISLYIVVAVFGQIQILKEVQEVDATVMQDVVALNVACVVGRAVQPLVLW